MPNVAAPDVVLDPVGLPTLRVPPRGDEPAVLAADPTPFLAHRARTLVVRACQVWGLPEAAHAAGLVADELVANAVVHAGTFVELHLRRQEGWLVVAVHDRDPAFSDSWWDCPGEDGESDPRGARYGLCIVRGTAAHVGGFGHPHGGKVVWAALPAGDERAGTIDLTTGAAVLGAGRHLTSAEAVRVTLQAEALAGERPGWRQELLLGWRAQEPGLVDLTLRVTPAHPALPQRHWQTPLELLTSGLERRVEHAGLRIQADPSGDGVVLELPTGPREGVRVGAARLRRFLEQVQAVDAATRARRGAASR